MALFLTILTPLLYYGALLLGFFIVAFVLSTLSLAALAVLRQQRRHRLDFRSAMCLGRVWHARFLPTTHKFTYPIFIFALDLEELDAWRDAQWPLSATIVQFRESDHLINGEGQSPKEGEPSNEKEEDNSTNSLAQRVLRLVAEKTQGKFRPTLETHRVVILTHFSYFGYNFNPVSFYYILEREDKSDKKFGKIDAIVGEVSNTPWQEMYCYVLHPDSVDRVNLPDSGKSSNVPNRRHYIFPKEFHVSPFMEMDYLYDWTFDKIPQIVKSEASSPPTVLVGNSLRRGGKVHFVAKLQIVPHDVMGKPFHLAWQLIKFPFYCAIIQIWIHYEAFWLFVKGVEYIPHPQGSETAASRAIAAMMTPLFALKDRIDEWRQNLGKAKPE